jgi:hypothetical protein
MQLLKFQNLFMSYIPYFEKSKGGLWDHLAVFPSVCVSPPPP